MSQRPLMCNIVSPGRSKGVPHKQRGPPAEYSRATPGACDIVSAEHWLRNAS